MTVDDMPAAVHFFHDPHSAGDGDLVLDGWRLDDGADLFRFTPHLVFFILLEDSVELEVVDHALTFQSDNQSAAFRGLDMVDLEQMTQEDAVVVLRDLSEIARGEDPLRQLGGRHLSAGGKCRHRLMVE